MKDKLLPVILNVYRIKEDSMVNLLGLSMFHTAIEFDSNEYAFGFLDEKVTGVYDIMPLTYDEGRFVESIVLGYVDRRKFFTILTKLKTEYIGDTYNFVLKNCNHFSNAIASGLFNNEIPKKYTTFLKLGEMIRKIF
jgi:hypothetical protein